jgi:SpoVK/Ycf46/Vps4 family AAA+-type ATPase
LDGINQIEKVVFLATTNYPEKLGPRIINRPSRFDKRFKIGYPNEESRRIYLEHLIGKDNIDSLNIDLQKWVVDTHEFSLAHLKELFTAVVILGDNYEDSLECLNLMKEEAPDSFQDVDRKDFGFSSRTQTKKRR